MLNRSSFIVAFFAAVSLVAAQGIPQPLAPEAVVQNLYRAQKAEKGPFFQTKDRALVDRFFTKHLVDLIWNDAVAAAGEVGAIEFDPLFGMQDNEATGFAITPSADKPRDEKAIVFVTFKSHGKKETLVYQLVRDGEQTWKIADIRYSQMKPSLKQTLEAAAKTESAGKKS